MLEPTPRQLACLALHLMEGRHEAAFRLGLSPRTVTWHLERLYQRLGVYNKWEAACLLGWVRIPVGLVDDAGAVVPVHSERTSGTASVYP